MSDRDTAVRVEGLGQLVRTLRAAGHDLDDLKAANQAASRVVLDASQSRVPRRTGALAATGRVNKAARKANVVYGRAAVPYAGPLEWGWPSRHITARHFVTGAAHDTQPQWLALYEAEIQKVVDSVKGT